MSDDKKGKKIEELETTGVQGDPVADMLMNEMKELQSKYDSMAMNMTKREFIATMLIAGCVGSGNPVTECQITACYNTADSILRQSNE